MNPKDDDKLRGPSRRSFLAATAGIVILAGAGLGAAAAQKIVMAAKAPGELGSAPGRHAEPFWGEHQAGIATPAQSHT